MIDKDSLEVHMLLRTLVFFKFFCSYVFWASVVYFFFGTSDWTVWGLILIIIVVFGRIVFQEIPEGKLEALYGGVTGLVFVALIARQFAVTYPNNVSYPDVPVWVVIIIALITGSYRFIEKKVLEINRIH